MVKNTQSNLIAKSKNAKHRFYQQIYYNLKNRGRGYSVLVNYQSFLSNLFLLAPPQLFLSINCIQSRLFRVSFIELLDFIIY